MTFGSLSKKETFSSLNKYQKQAIGLLSIGTFLEYFDLMLYIHMALFLNELFFPKTDQHTAMLLSALAFGSSYILRPFGAILFGLVGDKVGRKSTVIITTFMMAVSCVIMANLPTYGQIGIAASWIITICRIMQGMSSVGEIVGAQLYLTETLKPPVRYPCVMLMSIATVLGTVVALLMASLVTSHNVNWRYAFWIGAIIAVIGLFARNRLRETSDFIETKNKIKQSNVNVMLPTQKRNVAFKTILALFFLQSAWPICSYFSYIYCGNILKNTFGFTSVQVFHENLMISVANLILLVIVAYGSYKTYPLKLAKLFLIPFFIIIILAPYLLIRSHTAGNLFITRLLIVLFAPASSLVIPVAFMHVPVLKRFTYVGLSLAVSHSLFYCITPFSMVYLVEVFNYWGITIMTLPLAICFIWAIMHFEKLEKIFDNLVPSLWVNMENSYQ